MMCCQTECGWSQWRDAGCQSYGGECHNLRYRIPGAEDSGCGTYNVHVLGACECSGAQSSGGGEVDEEEVDQCEWGDWVMSGCVEVSEQVSIRERR